MTENTTLIETVSRRTVLKASAASSTVLALAGCLGSGDDDGGGTANDDETTDGMDDDGSGNGANGSENGDDGSKNGDDGSGNTSGEVDEPDGFEVEVLAPHAPFVDDLAVEYTLEYADSHHGDPIVVDVDDASTVVVARATWTEDSTSGWHRHPGPYVVNMVEGEIEITHEHDCVPRTYAAGDAWFGTGDVHVADSNDGATAYVTFLGIPDGEPATEWVEPVDC